MRARHAPAVSTTRGSLLFVLVLALGGCRATAPALADGTRATVVVQVDGGRSEKAGADATALRREAAEYLVRALQGQMHGREWRVTDAPTPGAYTLKATLMWFRAGSEALRTAGELARLPRDATLGILPSLDGGALRRAGSAMVHVGFTLTEGDVSVSSGSTSERSGKGWEDALDHAARSIAGTATADAEDRAAQP
jgi:hypothetical protein